MPTLSPDRETKTITLPKSGGEVTLYLSLRAGDMNNFDLENMEESDMSPSMMASALIKDWDFTDEDGNDLETKPENVDLLELADFTAIMEAVDTDGFLEQESQAKES